MAKSNLEDEIKSDKDIIGKNKDALDTCQNNNDNLTNEIKELKSTVAEDAE